MKKISLIYMLGGLSSRFGGKAKGLIKVGPNGETLLEYSLDQALENNFKKIIFIVSKKTENLFREYFGNAYKNIPIEYALQEYDESVREKPWGTNDALCSAKHLISGPFVICNGDDIYGKEAFSILFNHLNENNTDATLGYRLEKVLPEEGSVNRGIYELDGNYVKKINETLNITWDRMEEMNLSKDSLCSMNIFGIQKLTLNLLEEKLNKFKEKHYENPKIECYLPVELGDLALENRIKLRLYETDEDWIGVTNPEDEQIVRKILAD